jgi:hypothetical protein
VNGVNSVTISLLPLPPHQPMAYDNQDRCSSSLNWDDEGASIQDDTGVAIQYTSDTLVAVTDAYGIVRAYTIGAAGGRKR